VTTSPALVEVEEAVPSSAPPTSGRRILTAVTRDKGALACLVFLAPSR
jgi:peptide/nickel transport system permease protein